MKKDGSLRFLLAASGSGGHIFPALFVAERLKEDAKKEGFDVTIEFYGTGRPLDHKLIGDAGYKINVVPTKGITGQGIGGLVRFALNFPLSLWRTLKIIRDFKPDLVAGFGGYGSFYPVTLGALLGIRTWIHEAEAAPGLANRVLGIYATKVSTAFLDSPFASKKVVVTGHPVRAELMKVNPVSLKNGAPSKILVLGGSQGSRALDLAMVGIAPSLAGKDLEIFHQARSENIDKLNEAYKTNSIKARVVSFIDDMVAAYNLSDIVIARSGAGTVAEVSIVNRPSILIPLPSSQGGHQTVNAQALVKAGKAILVTEDERINDKLIAALNELLTPERYKAMLHQKKRELPTDAAQAIAKGCLELVRSV